MNDSGETESSDSLAGSLLLAHPALRDPNFQKGVVLISAHSSEEGAWGSIINRPKGKTLAEMAPSYASDPIGKVPVYEGGPVRPDEVILAGWRWLPETSIFKLYFGIGLDQARELIDDEYFTLRAFFGYAGWEKGQLENELRLNSWLVSRLDEEVLENEADADLWRRLVRRMGPEMRLLADFPDDPSSN